MELVTYLLGMATGFGFMFIASTQEYNRGYVDGYNKWVRNKLINKLND